MTSLPPERLPHFDGPLDFFLEAVRRQDVPIPALRLAPLVEQYLAYVRQAAGRDLGLQMEWIEMAAVLIRWKSRTLLAQQNLPPTEGPDAETEALRAGLIAQLLARVRDVAGELAQRREREAVSWAPPSSPGDILPEPALLASEDEEPEPFFSAWDLIQQAKELRAWALAYREEARERERNAYRPAADQSTIEEMSAWAGERLRCSPPGAWLSSDPLFAEAGSLPRQCCLFLAFLELAHAGGLCLRQEEDFETIYVSTIAANSP